MTLKKITRSNARGVKVSKKPQIGWMDRVERALEARDKCVVMGRVVLHGRYQWRALANVKM